MNKALERAIEIQPLRKKDLPLCLSKIPNARTSTAAEYFEAINNNAKNPAGSQIDVGKEPFLISNALMQDRFEPRDPLIPIWHVSLSKVDRTDSGITDHVMLTLQRGACLVPEDTLIVWR